MLSRHAQCHQKLRCAWRGTFSPRFCEALWGTNRSCSQLVVSRGHSWWTCGHCVWCSCTVIHPEHILFRVGVHFPPESVVLCALLWLTLLKYKHSLNSLRIFCKMKQLIDCTWNPFLYQHALQEASLQAGVCEHLFNCSLSSEIIT